jgi:dipeptidase E
MQKIVAIGGGELKDFETLSIDKEIIELTGKDHPRALFLPTASGDPEGYIETFKAVYGNRLGCKADQLLLIRERPSISEIEEKIMSANLIYVGGGNTLRMLKRWRSLGVDTLLKKALNKGTVLSGLSAGSVCWFEYGHSDSMRFSDKEKWRFIHLKALGFIPGTHCPHYHKESREKDFEEMMRRHKGVGIALDNNVALEVVEGKFRIIGPQKSGAYRVFKQKGRVVTQKVEQSKLFQPLEMLYNREE